VIDDGTALNGRMVWNPDVYLAFADHRGRPFFDLLSRIGAEKPDSAKDVFALLRSYAVSEDGALHAEKFFRTCSEEFAATRPAFRWRYLTALARVTASEYGRPAAGMQEARSLLKV